MPNTGSPTPLRTLFLSDLHLGALGARAERILDFLETTPADCYVLVGDVLDLWQPLLPNWSREDQAVVDHLRQRHEDGSRIVYLVGNHDPVPDRAPAGRRLPVAPQAEIVHVAADGRRYLVLHGDVVDSRLVRAHVCTRLGSRIDHALRRMDQLLGALRHRTSGEARTTIGLLIGSSTPTAATGSTASPRWASGTTARCACLPTRSGPKSRRASPCQWRPR